MQKNNSHFGFTLLEIILSITLFFVASSIFIANINFTTYLSKNEIETFISNIELVKTANASGDKSAKIIIKPEQNCYELLTKSTKTIFNFTNVKITGWTLDEIRFYEDSWTNGNTIDLVTDTKKYTITIAAITGRVKVVEV